MHTSFGSLRQQVRNLSPALMATLRLPPKTFLIVDRHVYELKLYQRKRFSTKYELIYSWPIAIGQIGYETPPGMYMVERKFLDPKWLVPNSDWAPEELRGTLIDNDNPLNPLKGAFLRLSDLDGIGIHGTSALDSLGTQASHGCIRVTEDVARLLYEIIPLNTPCYIA